MTDALKKCWVCEEPTKKPLSATVEHFRPIDWKQRHFVLGNFRAFGLLGGLRANLTLLFPFVNTVVNWKYRKRRVSIETPEIEGFGYKQK